MNEETGYEIEMQSGAGARCGVTDRVLAPRDAVRVRIGETGVER